MQQDVHSHSIGEHFDQKNGGRLHGARIAVIGGTKGIGLAIASAAHVEGAAIVLGGRDSQRRSDASRLIGREQVIAIHVDATDDTSVEQFFHTAGKLDHLVMSLGTPESDPQLLKETDTRTLQEHLSQSLLSTFRCVTAYVRHQRMTGSSSIVLVSGGLSRRPIIGKGQYTIAQWALEGFARALVAEVAPMRVNVIVPGLVRSPRWEFLSQPEREEFYNDAASGVPVGFIPTPGPVGSLAVEAMANPYISGSTLIIDGGWTSFR